MNIKSMGQESEEPTLVGRYHIEKYNIKHKNVLVVLGVLVNLLAAGFICFDFVYQTRQNTNLISWEIAEREIEKKHKTISQAIKEQFDNLKYLALIAAHYEDFGSKDFSKIFTTNIEENQTKDIKSRMEKLENGRFKFTRDDEAYYCNYAVIQGQDWYLFNISSAPRLNDYSEKSTFLGMLLMVKMVLLIIAVARGILLWIISNNRKVQALKSVLENVTNHAPGGMIQVSPGTMQLFFVNESLYQMIGCGAEEFEERYHNNNENLIYEPDRKMVLDKIKEKLDYCYEYKMRFQLQTYSGAVYWVQQVNNAYTENG